jgi:hypothetical protein
VISVTPNQVVVIAPAATAAGVVNIRLVNPDGQFVVASSAYTYVATALTVKVLSPNGGERYQPGQAVTIQWQSTGATSQSVKYTLDGTNYIDIVNDLPGSAQSTQWTVPQASTTTARVRVAIRDAAGTRVTDDSDAPFTIQPTVGLIITSIVPTSGPQEGGNQVRITGSGFKQGCVVRFGGVDAQVVSVTSTAVVVIAPPQSAPGPVNIRLVNPDGQFVVASSAYTYVATALTVKVISPNGGEQFQPGQAVTIQWQSTGAASQSVKYTLDGINYIDIVNDLPGSARSAQWTVPQANTTTARVRVAVRDAAGNRVTDDSDAPFTIRRVIGVQPVISSVAPMSGPATGGTLVTITGQNFQQGCAVRFGGQPGMVVSVTTTRITVRTPISLPGRVDVKVTNPDGGSVILAGGFTCTTTQMQATPGVRSMQVKDPEGIDPTEQFVTTATSGSVNAGKILVVELYYITIPPDLNLSFSLFALNVPPGVDVSFSPNPMSYSTIYMTITTELTATPGTYPITVAGEGDSEGIFVFPFDFLLRVDPPIPRVSITPANLNPEITPGGGVVGVPLLLKRRNFPGPVTLTANGATGGTPQGLPEGIQIAFDPQPTGTNGAVLNFGAAPGTAPGDYPVIISAEKKDGLVKVGEAAITLHVKSTGTLTVSISNIRPQVPNLGCATYSVTVTPGGGLRGTVIPSVMSFPAGIIASGKMPTFNPPELDIDMNPVRTMLTLPISDDVTPDGSRKSFTFNVGAMTKDGLVKAKPVEGSLVVEGVATVAVKTKPKNPDRKKILAGQKATFRLVFDRAQPDDCMQVCMKGLKALALGGATMPGFKTPRIVNDGFDGKDIVVEVETTAEAKGSQTFMIGAMRPNMEQDVMIMAGMITVEITTVTIDVTNPMPGDQFQGFENITFMWTTRGDTQAVRTVDFELMADGVAKSIQQLGLPGGTTMMNLDLPNPGGATSSVHDAVVRITGRSSNGAILAVGEQSFSIARTGTPRIDTVAPNPAKRGDRVDIGGGSFIPGKTQVFFTSTGGMVEADISELTATHISVTVPDEAISGSITVRNPITDPGDDHDANADFTVDLTGGTPITVVTAPQISSLSPVQGPVGAQVRIAGSSFTGATGVTFNGTPAQFQVVSASVVAAFVPAGTRTGPVTVTTPGGTARSAVFFQVTTLPTGGPIIRGPIGGGGRLPGGGLIGGGLGGDEMPGF